MSELNRLRELAALFRPRAEQVVEEASPGSLNALDGIRSVVDDAIGDLEDKLGHDGALEHLLEKNGLGNKLFISHLASGLREYKKETTRILGEIEKMLVELEMQGDEISDSDLKAHDEIFARHHK